MVIIIMLSVSIGVGWLDYYCLNFVVLNPVFLSCYQCQLVTDTDSMFLLLLPVTGIPSQAAQPHSSTKGIHEQPKLWSGHNCLC